MLFRVRAKQYPGLGVTLAYIAPEEVLPPAMSLAPEMTYTGLGKVVATTDHMGAGGKGKRLARATSCTHLQLERLVLPPSQAQQPAKSDQLAMAQFQEAIASSARFDCVMKAHLKQVVGVETGGWTSPPDAVQLNLEVEVPYSVKGLRSSEARKQRADDAMELAKYRLKNEWRDLALSQVYRLQCALLEVIEDFNADQVKGMKTLIELGIWRAEEYGRRTIEARFAHSEAQERLKVAQAEVKAAWEKYSNIYKRAVKQDLVEQHPDDTLLFNSLTRCIDYNEPLRFL